MSQETISSLLSCFACGSGEQQLDSLSPRMSHVSVSRRNADGGGARNSVGRSRSVERWNPSPDTLNHENGATVMASTDNNGTTTAAATTKATKGHIRAMSDPFDTQEDADEIFLDAAAAEDEFNDDEPMQSTHRQPHATAGIIATFPRYPFMATRNKNCYSEPPVDIFHVRGIDYFSDKKKVPSAPYLLRARGCDLFLMDTAKEQSPLRNRTTDLMGGQLRKAPTLAISFKFPWGYMNLYFEIPKHLVGYLNTNAKVPIDSSLSSPERTLSAWFQGDTDYRNERLKLIPYVAEGPWVVRNMVTGRPAIIGKKLPVSYDLCLGTQAESPLLTGTLDVGSSSATAKRIVSVCRRYMSVLTVDLGFVIQAETEAELPEQMLGAIRIHHPDPLMAVKL